MLKVPGHSGLGVKASFFFKERRACGFSLAGTAFSRCNQNF